MANEDLRIESADHRRFQAVLTLACQMMERANPGMLAAMIDPASDSDGHVTGMTVTRDTGVTQPAGQAMSDTGIERYQRPAIADVLARAGMARLSRPS
jgi:hypothetical protein